MDSLIDGPVLADRFCDGASQWIGGLLTAGYCEAHDQLAAVPGDVSNSVMSGFAGAISQAVGTVFSAVTSFWVHLPTPGVLQSSCDPEKAKHLAATHPNLSQQQFTARGVFGRPE